MAIHKSAKADSSAKMDCHALPSGKARNDKTPQAAGFEKTDSSPNDSKICGGAVVALQKLGKVSDLSGRAFHNFCNTAALLTQS